MCNSLCFITITIVFKIYHKWCKILPAQLLGIRQHYVLLKYTIYFQTFFYLQDHFGSQIIMHLRVCSLVISLDYSKLTDSLHKGLMCVGFFPWFKSVGMASVRLLDQLGRDYSLLCNIYVCFPLLILRSEMLPSRTRYHLTLILPQGYLYMIPIWVLLDFD